MASCSLGNSWKKLFMLLYLQNPNKLVLFVLFEFLEGSSKGKSHQKHVTFSGAHTLPIIIACTEDCYNPFTCTSLTAGLQPAAEVHPSSRCEPQTRFTGSLQKTRVGGFSRAQQHQLPGPSFVCLFSYHILPPAFQREVFAIFLWTKVDIRH